jgi:Family of unknown function (DUF6502)
VRHNPQKGDPIRDATIAALKHVADPLLELMFDTGVTVYEFNYLFRDRAVRMATKRVIKECGRNNKSRAAILTGLPRSEVTRILATNDSTERTPLGQHPARRVLAAWYDNPRFLAPTGEPAVLPIFGKRRSFEQLVSMHGGGIPVRAMLDELTQIDAVEQLDGQKVKAKSRVPILTGLTTNAIAAVGERCGDLIQTLVNNVRRLMPPLFEATAVVTDADIDLVPIVRRELAEQGASFINGANSFLKRSRHERGRTTGHSTAKFRVGVSVYYFETEVPNSNGPVNDVKRSQRKNLRRHQHSKTKNSAIEKNNLPKLN